MRPTFSACNLQYMMRKWTSIAEGMWKDRRPISQQLGDWLMYLWNVCEQGHFAWADGPQIITEKGAGVLSLGLPCRPSCVGGRNCCVMRRMAGMRYREERRQDQTVLWFLSTLLLRGRSCWAAGGVGNDELLDQDLDFCLPSASCWSQGLWGRAEIDENSASPDRLHFWSFLENKQYSACVLSSNPLLSTV